MAWVEIINEVREHTIPNEWCLCFQECIYHYDNVNSEPGYRFIWRRPNNSLQAARGQARIPSLAKIIELLQMASLGGWLSPEYLSDLTNLRNKLIQNDC